MTSAFPFSTVLLAIASDGAYALIVGLLLAMYWLGGRHEPRVPAARTHALGAGANETSGHAISPVRLLRPLLITCTVVLALAHAAKPWLLAANMSGLTEWRDVAPLIPGILNTTHVGTLWYIDAAAIAVLLATTLLLLNRSGTLPGWSAVACLCVIGFTKAATGHAAGDGDFTFRETVQALHILATAVWAGAVLISGLLVLPWMARVAEPHSVGSYGNRLSQTATGAVIVILASGIYTADRELNNSLSGLWSSSWGQVLGAKIFFVLAALALGGYNRFRSLKNLETRGDSAAFAKVAMAEAIVMVIVVCLSGLLGTLAPAQPNL